MSFSLSKIFPSISCNMAISFQIQVLYDFRCTVFKCSTVAVFFIIWPTWSPYAWYKLLEHYIPSQIMTAAVPKVTYRSNLTPATVRWAFGEHLLRVKASKTASSYHPRPQAQRVCESTVYGRADGSLGGFCCRHDTLLKDVVKAQYIWYRV